MDDQPGGLVDDQQMLVLENDPERDLLRLVMGRRRFGHGDRVKAARTRLGGRIANRDALRTRDSAARNQGLEPLARQCRNRRGKRTVKPPSGGIVRHARFDYL